MELPLGQRPATSLSAAEQNLLAAFRGGDAQAFQGLIRPHLPALLALALRQCRDPHWAEDLLQVTLLRAFQGLAGFRGEAALKSWLFRILLRLASDPSRWRLREQPATEVDVPDTFSEPPPQSAFARELNERLDEAMERLPARQRTALHLRAVEGMDYRQIAEALECTAAAARMLVLEARRKVYERIGEHLRP